ncbi:MAG: Rho termination factor N-terminal domain-containing protein, partial [Reyranellaceae bacterium]
MNLQDLKKKTPAELSAYAEELQIENASLMRKQELMFAVLKRLAESDQAIFGSGVIEVLPDGFGFLRSTEANYLAGPDDIYISPAQIRRYGLRTGDTVEGEIRAPKDGERYFALTKLNTINFEDPEQVRHRINFDNLTPLYPDEKLKVEIEEAGFVAAEKVTEDVGSARASSAGRVSTGGPRRTATLSKKPAGPTIDISTRVIDLIAPIGKGQ